MEVDVHSVDLALFIYLLALIVKYPVLYQCSRKTSIIHQTFVQWALHILFKFVKSLIRNLNLAIRNVWWFSWTLFYVMNSYKNIQSISFVALAYRTALLKIHNYTPCHRSWGGYTGCTLSVHLSRPPIRLSNRVCYVSFTILAKSLWYLHILSTNFQKVCPVLSFGKT